MARLTKTQRSDIQESLRQGVGISELARQHSVSRPTIRNIRDQMGIVPQPSGLSEVQAFRVNLAEQAALDRLVKAGKFRSTSAAMRALCRHAGDFFETDPEVFDALAVVQKELQAIGRNINQVARAVNSDVLRGRGGQGAVAMKGDLAELSTSLRGVAQLLERVAERDGETRASVVGRAKAFST